MNRMTMLAAVVGVAATGFVHGATYTNEVAAGVMQTFSQWEAEKGITIADGDTIVKKGPGILQADSAAASALKYNIIVEEGVFEHPNYKNTKTGGSVTVKKGACFYIHTAQQSLNNWTYNIEGEGTGVSPYLGAVYSTATASSGQVICGTWNLKGDATIFTKTGSSNYLFSGNSTTDGPIVNLNGHQLTLKGEGTGSMFRPRWKLTLNDPGTFLVDNCFYARHNDANMDVYNKHIPLFKLVNRAMISVDGRYPALVDAFEFDYGTSIGKTSAGGGVANTTLNKIIGCPTITSDATIGTKAFVVRGSDLKAGHALSSVNAFTFARGCTLDVTELDELEFSQDGTSYTVATSEASIAGTPTLIGDAAKLFTIANTGTAVTITTKPNAGAVFLPGEENAAANTAALAAFCSGATDGMTVLLSKGDYYFTGDFDLSTLTAANVTIGSIDNAATIHATLKLGAAENVTVSKVNFKGTTGPAIVANGTQGLKVADCTLDGVTGTWTDGKKYPYVVDGVADLEVTGCTSVNNGENRWDDTALFNGGSQTEASVVRAGEIVVVVLRNKAPNAGNTSWYYMDERMPGFNLATNTAYRGKTLVVTGDGATLDGNENIKTLGVSRVVVKKGQYVARSDNALGVAKGPVEVKNGGSLALAGGSKSLDSRTVQFEGVGLGGENPAIRFTGSSSWDKVQYAIWNLTGDATMYDNVGNGSNGNFLWATFQMNDHTLTLTGKSGGVYRIGRSCAWSGGGQMEVKGVKLSSTTSANDVKVASTTSFSYKDGKRPKFVFRDSATFAPESYEIQYLVTDIDFATANSQFAPGVSGDAKGLPHALAFSFYRFAGAPVVGENLESLTIESNYTVHAAQLKAGKTLTLACPLTFESGSTVTLDDLSGYPKPVKTLIATASSITGKPRPDDALKAAGWGVVKEGNSLYLDARQGTAIIIR